MSIGQIGIYKNMDMHFFTDFIEVVGVGARAFYFADHRDSPTILKGGELQ